MYTAFFLLGLLGYQEYLKRPKPLWYGLTLGAMLLSCLSKPAAVVFPIVMSLLVLVKDRKFIFKNYLHAIPFYVVALIFGLITPGTQSEAISDSDSFTFFDRLTLGFWANAVICIDSLPRDTTLRCTQFHPK
ncbi:MAG: hypothetical protein J4F31_08055 [Flavobacteriales bacterium]|nr:hypothetical protein [Flavobacteriales bacterium]